MQKRSRSILFFIDGMVPSEEEFAAAQKVGAKIRNAQLVSGKDEHADFVMGKIPKHYADVPVFGEPTNDDEKAAAEKAAAEKAAAEKAAAEKPEPKGKK